MKASRWCGIEAVILAASFRQAYGALFHCKDLVVDNFKFDLSKLGGPHSVVTSSFSPPTHYNTTYTLDICAPLKRKGEVKKGDECPNGTRVCGLVHRWDPESKELFPENAIPIAGDLLNHGGKAFEWEAKRLSTSDSGGDVDRRVRVIFKGGSFTSHSKRDQRAVIEFRCDKNKEGTEGEWTSEDQYDAETAHERRLARHNDDGSGTAETQLKKEGAALIFEGYTPDKEGESDTLWLTWHTKYVCEDRVVSKPDDYASQSWGFFTWLFFIAFLATASYLIFGSWLNYNRYGARGWDLLPHGDTIRDVPYLLKDWTRRMLNTVQSSGSRGGYSAV